LLTCLMIRPGKVPNARSSMQVGEDDPCRPTSPNQNSMGACSSLPRSSMSCYGEDKKKKKGFVSVHVWDNDTAPFRQWCVLPYAGC
jgi:hypothetical protein